jgi:alpha-ribazole phosphatase/probable phosphoglycerate mutase
MGTKVYLVRHGETEWNYQSRFQGTKDTELNSKGKQQAKKLASRLADKDFAAIYSSDLSRAYRTAQIITDNRGQEITQIADLKEINFGCWEGLTHEDLENDYEEEFNNWKEDPAKYSPPGGETIKELEARTKTALLEIIAEHPEEKILVVTHGGVIRTLVSSFLGVPMDKYWRIIQHNTAVNILNFYQGEVTIELLNCTAHLKR